MAVAPLGLIDPIFLGKRGWNRRDGDGDGNWEWPQLLQDQWINPIFPGKWGWNGRDGCRKLGMAVAPLGLIDPVFPGKRGWSGGDGGKDWEWPWLLWE